MSKPKCTVEELKRIRGITLIRTPEYQTWNYIIQRCFNPKRDHYHYYGGRGITMAAAWRNSFSAFLADMGMKPSPKHEIDRIDSNGSYSADNCRWVLRQEQARNKRNTLVACYNGETQSLSAWAEQYGLAYRCLTKRIRMGWNIEAALTEPSKPNRPFTRIETSQIERLHNQGLSGREIAKRLSRNRHTVQAIINQLLIPR